MVSGRLRRAVQLRRRSGLAAAKAPSGRPLRICDRRRKKVVGRRRAALDGLVLPPQAPCAVRRLAAARPQPSTARRLGVGWLRAHCGTPSPVWRVRRFFRRTRVGGSHTPHHPLWSDFFIAARKTAGGAAAAACAQVTVELSARVPPRQRGKTPPTGKDRVASSPRPAGV